jgi:hypothetical protein
VSSDSAAAYSLLNARVVRERAHQMLALGLDDKLPSFRVDLSRLDAAIELVRTITVQNYPALDVPFHSRWRHFVVDGKDRWAEIAGQTSWRDAAHRARAEFDLAMVSVFLDAGAGPRWSYRDAATGKDVGRSEGLALASLAMFVCGNFSSDSSDPLRADADALQALSVEQLRDGFQVSVDNPLVGLEGRATLLRDLGKSVASAPEVFATVDTPRPGGLFDLWMSDREAKPTAISAKMILEILLLRLGSVWPSRLTLGGVPLGDCWKHPSIATGDATSGHVPLHKLSQWLAYSLIEPLQTAGAVVDDIDGLTGLAEYRNGGLFVDAGILAFRDLADAAREHDVASPLVVEWRALTVALLDRLADGLRQRLGMDGKSLPLAKILQGGTWEAGRTLARERRSDGSPPVKVVSDGTVF